MDMPIRVTAAFKTAARRTLCLFTGALALVSVVSPAEAGWLNERPQTSTFQSEGGWHKGPRGYHSMCAREPELCMYDQQAAKAEGAALPQRLDDERWKQLNQINQNLNSRIRPLVDHGPDFWTIGLNRGDCEDYAIAKKHALIDVGWSPDQLLYAVVDGIRTRYHLVLVVRTDNGDYVLDNLTDRIRPWERSGYTFVIRQTATDPTKWAYVTRADARLAHRKSLVLVQ